MLVVVLVVVLVLRWTVAPRGVAGGGRVVRLQAPRRVTGAATHRALVLVRLVVVVELVLLVMVLETGTASRSGTTGGRRHDVAKRSAQSVVAGGGGVGERGRCGGGLVNAS